MNIDTCETCGVETGVMFWSTYCDNCRPLTVVERRAMAREIMEKVNAAHN